MKAALVDAKGKSHTIRFKAIKKRLTCVNPE